jgi:hypothetical protein
MFSIETPGNFLVKVESDAAALNADYANAGLAVNSILSLYHLHEWIWAKHFKATRPFELNGKTIRDKKDFIKWCDEHCPNFNLVQELANGTKHCSPVHSTTKIKGFGEGPWGIGPYGMAYLLIDLGEAEGSERWKIAHAVVTETAAFWRSFVNLHAIS